LPEYFVSKPYKTIKPEVHLCGNGLQQYLRTVQWYIDDEFINNTKTTQKQNSANESTYAVEILSWPRYCGSHLTFRAHVGSSSNFNTTFVSTSRIIFEKCKQKLILILFDSVPTCPTIMVKTKWNIDKCLICGVENPLPLLTVLFCY